MVWIVFHSQTEAIQCRDILARAGILGRLGQPPHTPQHPSCAWAIAVGWDQQTAARMACTAQGIQPCAWIKEGGIEL